MTSPERPAAAHDFDFLIGSWIVDHCRLTQRLVRATDWDTSSGTAVCRSILDGIGNVDEIFMPSRGATGMTARLFDDATGRWSLHWASSLTGVLEPPVVGGFDDGVGHVYGDDTHDGRPVRSGSSGTRSRRRPHAGSKPSPPTKSGPGKRTGSCTSPGNRRRCERRERVLVRHGGRDLGRRAQRRREWSAARRR